MTDPSNAPASTAPDYRSELISAVGEARCTVRAYLDTLAPTAYDSWWKRAWVWIRKAGTGQGNPVRIKNLEKALALLLVLQHMLADSKVKVSTKHCETLGNLLVPLRNCKCLETLSFNNAWELTDMLEAELMQFGDHGYIKGVWLTWPRSRKTDDVRDIVVNQDRDLLKNDDESTLETTVRPWLLEDQRDLAHEYRRDRAMITLRRSVLNFMAIALLVLDLAFCGFLISTQRNPLPSEPMAAEVTSESDADSSLISYWSMLLLVMVSGAIGSVVARATKLSRQPLPSEPVSGKGQEMPLGIRSLMSTWSVLLAQVMLGATAGLVIYLVFSSRLLVIEGLEAHTPAPLAVLAFIAGFSEPFLTNVVDGITRRVV